MNDIIDPLIANYPSASVEDIAEAIITYVESSFPEILRTIHIPKRRIPVPTQIAIQSLRKKRTRKFARLSHITSDSRENLIRELFWLRTKFDGAALSRTRTEVEFDGRTGSDTFQEDMVLNDSGKLGRVEEADGVTIKPELTEPAGSFQSYTNRFSQLERPKTRFSLGLEMPEILEQDTILQDVLRKTEVNLRATALQSTMEIGFHVGLETDPEYPNWKRYVVTADLSANFETKMTLWPQLDKSVRKSLRELEETHPELSSKIREIGKNLFVHMELA